MNYKQRSKNYGKWVFVKYPSDCAIYASCKNCSYTYKASTDIQLINNELEMPKPSLEMLYRYCPNCGLKMKPFNGMEVYRK